MTREEAREWLLQIKDRIRGGDEEFDARRHEALDMAIEALNHSVFPNSSDLISRSGAIDAICKDWCNSKYKDCKTPFNQETDEYYHCDGCGDIETLLALPSAEPKTGECKTCKRSSDYRWSIGENDTRCPIEEHYALPKDGYCHLYEPYREDSE